MKKEPQIFTNPQAQGVPVPPDLLKDLERGSMRSISERWRRFNEECKESEVEAIATQAHFGQKRRSGEDYISHPRAAAELGKQFGYSDVVIDAAWLHDSLEDAADPKGVADLIRKVCPEALPIVQELTHDKDITYTDYVLSLSPDAIAVKMLDMWHNAQDLVPGSKQFQKYQNALSAFGGKPSGVNEAHWQALTQKLEVENENA